jgi:2-keto-3-deoxy-L-fuconate dehydrogenase
MRRRRHFIFGRSKHSGDVTHNARRLPGMLADCGELIVNMASVASTIIPAPNRFVYCARKAAVIGGTKQVAADFVTKNVRADAIYAGTI